MELREYRHADRPQVIQLWVQAFPNSTGHNDPATSIDRKVNAKDHLFFVATEAEVVVGTVMAGYDGHRGWLYSLAVREDRRRMGIGEALVHHAEQALQRRGCPKLNLQVRGDNSTVVPFYQRLGYDVEDRTSMGKRLAPAF